MLTYEQLLNRDLDWALREGSSHFEGLSAPHRTVRRFAHFLDDLGVDYAILGDLAYFFHGYRRFTEIVEVLVTADGLRTIRVNLECDGSFCSTHHVQKLRDADTGVLIKLFVSGHCARCDKSGAAIYPEPTASLEIYGLRVLDLSSIIQLKLASGNFSHRIGCLADVQELIKALYLPLDFQYQISPTLRELYQKLWYEAQEARKDDY